MSNYTRWSPDEDLYILLEVEAGDLTYADMADFLNKHKHNGHPVRTGKKVKDRAYQLRKNGEPDYNGPRDKREWGEDGSTVIVSNRAYSDEEMAEMFDVDMTRWHVTKRVTNVWGAQTQTKLWWAPIELNIVAQDWDKLLEDAAALRAPVQYKAHNRFISGHSLYQINIFDAHIGMKAWGPETGEDYDLNIGIQRYYEAFMALLMMAPPEARILLPIGQDLFHFDTLIQGKGGATSKGTPQDVDTRWQKLFVSTAQMLVAAITEAASLHEVDVIIVPGNHDSQTTFYAGQYLQAYFKGVDHIRFDTTPRTRKYYRFGQVLLGFTHGNEEKSRDLFGIMADEAADSWSDTYWREWHRGHVHQEEVSEDGRMRIRTMPGLTGRDSWHSEKGYRSIPGARAFLWDKEHGLLRQEYYNVPRHKAETDGVGVVLSS